MKSLDVSYSKIRTFRTCRQLYHYKYVRRLRKVRKAQALVRGSIIHSAIEAHILGHSWKEAMTDELDKVKFHPDHAMLSQGLPTLLRGYFKHNKEQDATLRYEHVEEEMRVPLIGDVNFLFIPDGVAIQNGSRRWLVERKSHKVIPSEESRVFNLQSLLYTWGLWEKGIMVDGVLWDYLRAKIPTVPKLTDSGKRLQMKANIDTTEAVYRAAIKANGLDPAPYEDFILTNLRGNESRFYKRRFLPIKPKAAKIVVEEARITALEIKALGEIPTRHMTKDCERCDFFSLCSAELMGDDTSYILEHDYEKAKEAEIVVDFDGDQDEEEAGAGQE